MSEKNPNLFNDYFLGIGINKYQHFSTLSNPVKDIEDVTIALNKHYGLKDFENLFDADATRKNILKKIKSFKHLGENDRLILFFSGHGELIKETDTGYWVPYDGEQNEESTWISDTDLTTHLKYLENCKHVLVISDSCFGGHFLNESRNVQVYIKELLDHQSRWGLASGFLQVSDGPRLQNSPFTKALLQVLKANTDYLPVVDLPKKISSFLATDQEHQPPFCGPITAFGKAQRGQFVFVSNRRDLQKRQLAFEEAQQKDTLPAWNAFLLRFPENSSLRETAEARFREIANQQLNEAYINKDKKELANFSSQYPHSLLSKRAQDLILQIEVEEQKNREKNAWMEALNENTVSAYQWFINHFGASEFRPEANLKLIQAQEREGVLNALDLNSTEEVENFLKNHQHYAADNLKKIEQHLADLRFQQAHTSTDIQEIDRYLKRFSDLLGPDQLQQLLKKKRALEEKEVYGKTTAYHKESGKRIQAFINYFTKYPEEGAFFSKATEGLIQFLQIDISQRIWRELNWTAFTSKKERWSGIQTEMKALSSLPFWTAYQDELGIPADKRFYPTYKVQEMIDYMQHHFPGHPELQELKKTAESHHLKGAFHTAKTKNELDAYADFWRTPGLTGKKSEPKQTSFFRKYRLASVLLGIVIIGAASFFSYRNYQINKADRLFFEGKYQESLDMLTPYLNSGDRRVLHFYSAAYNKVTKDGATAVQYLKRALEKGFFRSYFVLGWMHIEGYTPYQIEPDTILGLQYLHKASELNEPRAMYYLGHLYKSGLKNHLNKDIAKSYQFFKQSALAGDTTAQLFLGEALNNEKDPLFSQRTDERAPYFWYRMAAIEGSITGIIRTGICYHEGIGVDVDHDKELYWYQKAADQGSSWAIRNIGNVYYAQKKYSTAFTYYQKAAKAGDNYAQLNLVELYEDGKGTTKDIHQVLYWLEESIKSGEEESLISLGEYYYLGYSDENDTLQADVHKAYPYLVRSAQQENKDAFWYLGNIHLEHPDFLNKDTAVYYMKKAHSKGNLNATAYLAKWHFDQEQYRNSANMISRLIQAKDFRMDTTRIELLVSLLNRKDSSLYISRANTNIEKAVDLGYVSAEPLFFEYKYERLLGIGQKEENKGNIQGGINSSIRKIALSPFQIDALRKYQNTENDKLLFLLSYFIDQLTVQQIEEVGLPMSEPAFAFNAPIKDEKAIELLLKAESLHNPYASIRLGMHYQEEGKLKEAKRHFLKAEQAFDGKEVDESYLLFTYLSLGEITQSMTYAVNDDYAEPIEYYRKALGIDPLNFKANMNLCRIYHQNDKLVPAKSYCERAMQSGNQEATKICIERGWYTPPEEPGWLQKIIDRLKE